MPDGTDLSLITMTADITSAYLNHNSIASHDLPAVIASIYAALQKTRAPEPVVEPSRKPAVPIRASIKPDYLICLEDGKKLRMLKRYLKTQYGMTPASIGRNGAFPTITRW